jgi:hypothetical protein
MVPCVLLHAIRSAILQHLDFVGVFVFDDQHPATDLKKVDLLEDVHVHSLCVDADQFRPFDVHFLEQLRERDDTNVNALKGAAPLVRVFDF